MSARDEQGFVSIPIESVSAWVESRPAVDVAARIVAFDDALRSAEEALQRIAASYSWLPYEDGEMIANAGHESITPTNRRIAREALAKIGVLEGNPELAAGGQR